MMQNDEKPALKRKPTHLEEEEGDYTMDMNYVTRVDSLIKEINNYEQTISNAADAMASAESELTEVLTDLENQINPTV